MSDFKEIVIPLKRRELPPGIRSCPDCRGTGKNADGHLSMSNVEVRYKPATDCRTCGGSGLVRIEAFDPSELAAGRVAGGRADG
jgi:DnaJ-class molecular chaperone